ncbi:MAG TPA: DUF5961 family protein [Caulobacteraceae bacterium]|jgi:hypothetical protein|nr:DUF5961 family protein [Caulobacteraceae bacterium]
MPEAEGRLFLVRSRHIDRHHAHVVGETSFEAAAVAFLEHWQEAPDDDNEVVVIVQELSSGHEHCFRVDLETGVTGPCE